MNKGSYRLFQCLVLGTPLYHFYRLFQIHTGEEFSLIMKSASGCKALQRRYEIFQEWKYFLCIYASIQSHTLLATQFIAATCLTLSNEKLNNELVLLFDFLSVETKLSSFLIYLFTMIPSMHFY
jgi:hypothetical protein